MGTYLNHIESLESQKTRILNHLLSGKSITPIGALQMFDCFRLGARISDLRKEGHKIKTIIISKGSKRFAKYVLE